jgi:hypothetical protein
LNVINTGWIWLERVKKKRNFELFTEIFVQMLMYALENRKTSAK